LQQLFHVKRSTQAKGTGRQGDENILTLEREVTEGWRQQGERASLLVPFAKYLFFTITSGIINSMGYVIRI